jgi:4-carboxymuconolactone decarboxylase
VAESKDNDTVLKELAEGNLEALEILVTMNVLSMESSGLDPDLLMLVRIAALAAIDAPAASWLANLGIASETDITLDQVRGTLVAIAPLIGTARVISAAGKIREVLFPA